MIPFTYRSHVFPGQVIVLDQSHAGFARSTMLQLAPVWLMQAFSDYNNLCLIINTTLETNSSS